MKYNNENLDILAFPLPVAEKKIHNMGYKIGKITYTFAPKQKNDKVFPRIIRQKINKDGEVDIVMANAPWEDVVSEGGWNYV